MNPLLTEFQEQIIDAAFIPSFQVRQGDLVVIQMLNSPAFHNITSILTGILAGEVPNSKTEIITPLKYAPHVRESGFKSRLFPQTVGKYLDQYANKESPLSQQIYNIEWMTEKIKIRDLAGTPRRKLSIYATLSWTNKISYDLVGVDPAGGKEIYNFIKRVVQPMGAAVLVDYSDEFRNDCTTFVETKYIHS